MRRHFYAVMMRDEGAEASGRSRVETEIKKKIRRLRKISCEILLTEFISLVFGGFTSNVVFGFFSFEAFGHKPKLS